ncbi:hypothetical protein BV25DRAFT_1825157 [Artomyces pyxidatus]|uniref:Uncharacterized protein n=1 Tax=Artomyces pyxidatus TaxID=48021 RepID=A0ACB8T3C5_9AGAM|nr:hypothetical protein BV25DRAFT_1825157 [Artomyces pyxidatus]
MGAHHGPLPFSHHCFLLRPPFFILNITFSLSFFHLLGRRSPSPRSIHRSPPRNRQVDRGYPSPQSEAPPPLPLTRPPPRQSRASSPPPRPRASDATRRHDPYAPNDDLPQRRVRERTSAEFDSDHDVKRRRTDVRSGDSAPARRAPMETDGYIPRETSTTSTSPRSMINQADQNRTFFTLDIRPRRHTSYRILSLRTSRRPQAIAPSSPKRSLPGNGHSPFRLASGARSSRGFSEDIAAYRAAAQV